MVFLMVIFVILFQFPLNLFAQEAKYTCKDIEDMVIQRNEVILDLLKLKGMDCTCKTEGYILRLKELGADESIINEVNSQCVETGTGTLLYSILIRTFPKDAKLYMTGDTYKREYIGLTGDDSPLSIKNLKPGEYYIEIEKEGYISVKEKKYITKDEILNYTLNTLDGNQQAWLTVTSDPEGASVYIDTEYKGITPLTLSYPYTIKLNIEVKKGGYNDKSTVVDVESKLHKKVILTLQSKPKLPETSLQIEFEYYDASGRYLITQNNVVALAKNQISLSRLNYWANNRFDIFLDLGGVKSALSESEKSGDMNFLYGGGIKWIIFSFPSLDLDLRGEFLSFTNKQEGIGTYKREIAWSEYDGSTTLTSMAFQHIRPYFSVLLSKINSKVKYINNMNQQIADFDFSESDPFGVAAGTKIVAGRFSLDGKIIAADINNSNSENKKSIVGYSIGMAYSF